MTKTSNIDEVIRWLNGWVASFKFDRPGEDQSLGRDLGHTVVRGPEVGQLGGILGRAAQGIGPDGSPWAPNDPGYRKFKLKKYGHEEVNRRTGQMLSEASFRIIVGPDEVRIEYGLGVPPDRSTAPTGYISDSDKAVTDTEKARYAHGSTRGRPARPFFGFDHQDYINVIKVCQSNLDEYIRETNQKNGV